MCTNMALVHVVSALAVMPPWKDPSLPVHVRADDLLQRMPLSAMVGQFSNSAAGFLDQPRYEFGQECLAGFQGSDMWATNASYVRVNSSAFPHAVSLGMSFDTSLVRSIAAAIATEARAAYNHYDRPSLHCQSPVLNIARDPRWGRCMESYGEDPTVVGKLGRAYVTGIQHGDMDAPATEVLLMAASPKHFANYNLECYCFPGVNASLCNPASPGSGCHEPYGIGRNKFDPTITAHDMRETYLAGWRAAAHAGAQGAMCSSNAVNGIPLCAHGDLLNNILKGEFGLDGAVISDGNGVTDIFHQPSPGIPGHEYAHDYVHAAAFAMNAGCDQSWDFDLNASDRYGEWPDGILARALAANLTTLDAVKAAAKYTLLPRFRAGLYDPAGSNPWDSIPVTVILSAKHVTLAARAATASHTLLKNSRSRGLPLRAPADGGPRVVGVVGAAANNPFLSMDRYTGRPNADAIVMYTDGISTRARTVGAEVHACPSHATPVSCAASLKAAGAQAVVVVTTGQAEGEQHDRADLGLPADQEALVKAVRAALPEATIVLVVVSGGAVSTERVESVVDATVWAGKAGMQAGTGFAALLYGDVDFSGRVAATVYRTAWESTNFLDTSISTATPPRGYRYLGNDTTYVLYPFGHGLSYGTYTTRLDQPVYTIAAADVNRGSTITVNVSVSVEGIDAIPASRSVLAFLSHALETTDEGHHDGATSTPASSLPRRKEWLADFTKVQLHPQPNNDNHGARTATATLALGADALGRWWPASGDPMSSDFVKGQYNVFPGHYVLRVTDTLTTATVVVT
eukprot:m.30090 g.30090  ORF g.30090 m.30090 type:complete len:800 (+) comp4663_c0_seq1:54-2453(+)